MMNIKQVLNAGMAFLNLPVVMVFIVECHLIKIQMTQCILKPMKCAKTHAMVSAHWIKYSIFKL